MYNKFYVYINWYIINIFIYISLGNSVHKKSKTNKMNVDNTQVRSGKNKDSTICISTNLNEIWKCLIFLYILRDIIYQSPSVNTLYLILNKTAVLYINLNLECSSEEVTYKYYFSHLKNTMNLIYRSKEKKKQYLKAIRYIYIA